MFLVAGLCTAAAWGEEDSWLLRVDGHSYSRSEFVYAYRHFVAEEAPSCTPDEYVKLFALRKMQVEAARKMGLDTTRTYLSRLTDYRKKRLKHCLISSGEKQNDTSVGSTGRQTVKVMQLFKRLPQHVSAVELETTRQWMDSLYKVIIAHPETDFNRWVQQYSDDKETRCLFPSQTTEEMEAVLLSLSEGEISTPFFTPEGIHILKVVSRKVADTSGSSLQGEEIGRAVERLKKELGYRPNEQAFAELRLTGTTSHALFTLAGRVYTADEFARFSSSHPLGMERRLQLFVVKSVLDCAAEEYLGHHPELMFEVQAYADSCLVAAVKQQAVDIPAANDKTGQKVYFELHKSDYYWETPKYRGIVVQCVSRKIARKVKRILKRAPEKLWQNILREMFNSGGQEAVRMEYGLFACGDNPFVDRSVFKKKEVAPSSFYPFVCVKGEKIKGPENYQEVLERLKIDYRDYLEACLKKELYAKMRVEINQEVLKTVNNESHN